MPYQPYNPDGIDSEVARKIIIFVLINITWIILNIVLSPSGTVIAVVFALQLLANAFLIYMRITV